MFDVEYPYAKIGAPKTGLAIKTFLSKRAAGEEKAIKAIWDLGKYKLSKQDYSLLAFIAERPGLFATLTDAQKKLFSPAYQHIRKYFDDYSSIHLTILLRIVGNNRKPFPITVWGHPWRIDAVPDEVSRDSSGSVLRQLKIERIATDVTRMPLYLNAHAWIFHHNIAQAIQFRHGFRSQIRLVIIKEDIVDNNFFIFSQRLQ